jgi:alkanesulfonate monooxygenase SsuD/methylene tetrahydromethanopterin reductase-like flavin-dependent oxidoreductase (luciferase family)
MTPNRAVALARQAEQAGFGYGWLFDSHVLWLEPYPLLTLIAQNTSRMRLGTCVTNPASRDPSVTASVLATLNIISGGRMDLGIGRGDSARRVLGKKPTTLARLEEAVRIIKDLAEGRPTDYDGEQIRMDWARGELPVWIGSIQVMAATAVWVSDDVAMAREHVRWFPALVSNHVMDLVNRYDPAELPPELTAYVRNREGYDYQHHAEVGSSNAQFVSDEVTDRFCIVGTAAQHRAKLEELADAGVTQFNIYLMSGDEEATLEVYGREIVPSFAT